MSPMRRQAEERVRKEEEKRSKSYQVALASVRKLGAAGLGVAAVDVVKNAVAEHPDLAPGAVYGAVLHLRDAGLVQMDDGKDMVFLPTVDQEP